MQLEYALQLLTTRFDWQYPSMDFLFTHRTKSSRVVTSIMRGIPSLKMSLVNESESVVRFECTQPMSNTPKTYKPNIGWQDMFQRKTKPHQFTHCFLAIPKVYQVLVYDYGFSILSTSGIDMFAIISKYWDNADVGALMSRSGEQLILPLCDEKEFPPQTIFQNTSDDFKLHNSDIAFPIGQATKELILED